MKSEIKILIVEFTLVSVGAILYSTHYGKLTYADIAILITAIVGAIHSVLGHFLKFSFFGQYPEGSERNKKKNTFISLATIIISFAIVGLLLWGLREHL